MGRPKQYATPAARQAAYRHRMRETTTWVNRAPYQRMEQATHTLYQLIHRAAAQDHDLATRLVRATPLDTLDAVVDWVTAALLHDGEEDQRFQKGNRSQETNTK